MRSSAALILLFFVVQISAQKVYKTPTGKKYHLASCRMVKNVSHQLDISVAARLGLTGCSICNPPSPTTMNIIRTPTNKKAQGVNSQNRCNGRTKNGSRCKRYTRIGNDFCFQHLP